MPPQRDITDITHLSQIIIVIHIPESIFSVFRQQKGEMHIRPSPYRENLERA
jgi:hypothetical protein